MSQQKREKSTKYPGVYWRLDAAAGEKTYYIRYRLGGRGSKEVEEPVGKSSAGMTEAKASIIRADRMRGKEASNKERRQSQVEQKKEEFTLQTAWDAYSEVNSHKSLYKTDRCLIKYFRHLLNVPVVNIKTSDIDAIRKKLENTPSPLKKNGQTVMLAPASIVHVLSLIRRLINFSVKRGLCSMPDNLYFQMPKVDNQKTEMLSDDDISRLLKALDEEPNQNAACLIRLALVTGMRKGALLGLRWDDCDFDRDIIRLRGESAKKGKTDYIPMNSSAKSILQALKNGEYNRVGYELVDSDYVFPGKDGGKRSDYRRIARRVKEKAGLPDDFRPLHGLRHNFASRLASSGDVELYVLQKLLTHTSPQMTQRYAHLRDETLKKAASIADSMLQKK